MLKRLRARAATAKQQRIYSKPLDCPPWEDIVSKSEEMQKEFIDQS